MNMERTPLQRRPSDTSYSKTKLTTRGSEPEDRTRPVLYLSKERKFSLSSMLLRLADLGGPAVAQSRGNLLTGAWLSAWTSIADVLYSNHLSFWKRHH